MTIFETKRLIVHSLLEKDYNYFVELLSDPRILSQIPQAPWPKDRIQTLFQSNLNYLGELDPEKATIWGIFEKEDPEMIGMCALLKNDEDDWELGYRFRVKYWRKGFGTEVTRALIDYCFNERNLDKITADVDIKNQGSVKILEKFMSPVREFYNEKDDCTDRRYEVFRK